MPAVATFTSFVTTILVNHNLTPCRITSHHLTHAMSRRAVMSTGVKLDTCPMDAGGDSCCLGVVLGVSSRAGRERHWNVRDLLLPLLLSSCFCSAARNSCDLPFHLCSLLNFPLCCVVVWCGVV